MRKFVAILSGVALMGLGSTARPQSPMEEYNKFRQQILSDFQDFKTRILEHYSDFLNGEWHEFEPLWEEESPYTEPKPEVLPELPPLAEREPDPEPEMARLPDPSFNPTALPGLNAPVPGNLLAEGNIKEYDYPSLRIDVPDMGGSANPKTSVSAPDKGQLAEGSIKEYDYPSLKIDTPEMGGSANPKTSASAPDKGQLAEGSIKEYNYPSLKIDTPEMGGSANPKTSASTPDKGQLAEGSIKEYNYPSLKIDTPDFGGGSRDPWASAAVPQPKLLGESDAMRQQRSNYERAALRLPDPDFAFGSFPGQTAAADPKDSGIVNIDMKSSVKIADNYFFDFYGMEAFIPEVEFNITSNLAGPEETGRHWDMMAAQEGGKETARQLFGLAENLGLNGYLTFRLAESYVNQRFKGSNLNARMSAVHYLLSTMGYDVRLLKLNDFLTVMMPFDQKVVYSTLTTTANNGRKYTILYPDGQDVKAGQSVRLMTCDLPSNAGGKTSDLRLTGLNLPENPKAFTLTNGKLTLKGEVNENIRNILYHYPQMPNGDFASSWVDSRLREDLVGQLRTQLAGMPPKSAVDALMALCHYGFRYRTDQEWHGFEKPYFLEESLLYDYNDCEDRAIFFSYLIWNTLGIPCQMVQYPGHESATVALADDIKGYYYNTDGVRYYSADPTYIGSNVGMVMKAYRGATPVIDKQYSKD